MVQVAAAKQSVGTAPSAVSPADARTWLWVHLGTLAAAVPILVWVNRDQWFAGDEWVVVTSNGLGSNPTRLSLFAPHFEHWITLGVLVYKALYGAFALRSYWPYVAVMIVVILAVAHMTWRLLLRVGVTPAYATALAALTTVLAVGWENRSTAFQMVVIAPVALGFGALLLMPTRGPLRQRDIGVVVLLLLGLMCSGTGVTMAAVVTLAALLRRGWRVALGIVAVPAAVYSVWYVLEGTSGQRNNTALSTALGDLPGFAWRGLTDAFGGLTRVPDSGAVVVVALVAWIAWRARPRQEPWPLVVATTVGALFSISLTGLRRAGAEPASRYTDIVVLLALPAVALATQEVGGAIIRRVGRPALAICSVLVVGFLVVQVVALDDEVSHEAFVGEMKPRVLATARIMRDHEPLATTNIFGIPYLTEPSTTTIARLDRHGELPALDVSTADVLTARGWIEAVVGDASHYPEGVVESVTTEGASTAAAAPGCVTVAPARPGTAPVVRLVLPRPGSFRVATARLQPASLAFVQGHTRGRPREFDIAPGAGTGIGVSRATDIELTLPKFTTTLCGLGATAVRPA
jgi:hypothetical protein